MRCALFAAVVLMALSGSGPARAADAVVVAVAPFTFTPHPIEVSEGQGLTFGNFDAFSGAGHTIVHDVPEDTRLFETPAVVPPGTAAGVPGIDELPVGTYEFTCRIHTAMAGTLIVS